MAIDNAYVEMSTMAEEIPEHIRIISNADEVTDDAPIADQPDTAAPVEPETTQAATDEPDDTGAQPTRYDKRINQLVAQRNFERDERLKLQARLEAIEAQQHRAAEPEPVDQPPPRPEIDDYDSTEDYIDAYSRWQEAAFGEQARQVYREEREREAAERAQSEAQDAESRELERINASIVAAQLNHSDFDEAIMGAEVTLNETARTALLLQTADPGEVMYHLSTHPKEARRINEMTSLSGILAAYGAIENQLHPTDDSTPSDASDTPQADTQDNAPRRQPRSLEPTRGSTEPTHVSARNPYANGRKVSGAEHRAWMEQQELARRAGRS